jgi:hypothetical protein
MGKNRAATRHVRRPTSGRIVPTTHPLVRRTLARLTCRRADALASPQARRGCVSYGVSGIGEALPADFRLPRIGEASTGRRGFHEAACGGLHDAADGVIQEESVMTTEPPVRPPAERNARVG